MCALVLVAVVCAVTAGSAYAATPPVNTVAPSLSGTAQDGKALTVNRGTWTGTATITYAYQWQQSSDGGSSWSDIAGATSTSYTPPAGFAGKQVRANVTATNSAGSGQASSPVSAVILSGPPVNTVAPSLSGTAQDGKALTVNKGTWTGGATIAYTYQWQVSTDSGSTWNDIAGAATTSYTPPAGSAGKQVRANVTATNADGTSQASSPASAVILAAPPVNTVAPSLSGTAQDGKALTVAKGTWTGVATITYAYQWQVSTDGGTTWSDIAGAASTSYTPPAGSAGKQVRATRHGDERRRQQPGRFACERGHHREPTGEHHRAVPLRDRTGRCGADRGRSARGPAWPRSRTRIAGRSRPMAARRGPTSPARRRRATRLPAGYAGKQVRVLVTGTNGDGSLQVPSPASAVILSNPPTNTVAPTLSGTAQDGKALTVAKGTWTGVATITYAYQWQVSTDGGSTWTPISGATGTTYTPPAGSAGKQVRAQVTATNGDGTNQAFTSASAVILSNPPVNTVAPSLSGTAQDGKALTAAKGTWTGMATIVYAYQWQVSTDGGSTWNDIAGATSSSYTPPAGSAGKQVRVVVTGTNGDGNSQAMSPASAVILAAPPANTVAPSLSGTAQDGKILSAANGTWTGIATITYTYQWQVSTDGGSSWADIPGATSGTFTPPAGYAGKQVRVVVTGTNGDGNSQAMSAASAVILGNPPVNTVTPTVSGTAQDGSALTAATGTWTGLATIDVRVSVAGVDGRRLVVERHRRRNGLELHASRRLRRQAGPRSRHGDERRRQQPGCLGVDGADDREPAGEHDRAGYHGHGPGRPGAHGGHRSLDRPGDDHVRVSVADVDGRRLVMERHRRRDRSELHASRRLRRETGARRRHRDQPGRQHPGRLGSELHHSWRSAGEHDTSECRRQRPHAPAAQRRQRGVEWHRDDRVHVSVAVLDGRWPDVVRHLRRDRLELHAVRPLCGQSHPRRRDRDERRREQSGGLGLHAGQLPRFVGLDCRPDSQAHAASRTGTGSAATCSSG